MYYKAPTYNLDTKEWGYTEFETRKEMVLYIDSKFKYPGEYELRYTDGIWNEQGLMWERTGAYPLYVPKSVDFKKHWNFEKEKCQFDGFVIYKSEDESLDFAVPGLMYWYLNYCPILDKVKQRIAHAEIYDGDYHYFLYILRCILHRKYGVVLKKRQAGYTLKNMAILLNAIWFGDSAVSKIFASDKNKVEDSWGHMEKYRDHINRYCGWKRNMDPSRKLDWQIRRKQTDNSYRGNLSIAKGFTTQQSPTNGVGGNATVIFGEEAGINSTLDITHEYITSNVGLGGVTTGLIIYSGAVGELDKAEPLKKFILKPRNNNFLPCENRIEEDAEFGDETGFFAPEWWNYISIDEESGETVKYYDRDGNTNKEGALLEIKRNRKHAELKEASSYRYYCSQRPLSIKEAFAYRRDAYFNQEIVVSRITRFGIEEPTLKEVVLYENKEGKITWRSRDNTQFEPAAITKFPLGVVNDMEKRGCVVIKEFPEANPERFTYFAGVDDIATDRSTTSESLFTIVIFKNIKETRYQDGDVIKLKVEGNKPVAWYTGRMSDMKETHQIAEYLIRYYNAFAAIENNVQNFINYMQARGLQHMMATKADFPFLQDMGQNANVRRDYGIYLAANGVVKDYLLSNAKEYITEELGKVRNPTTGEVTRTIYGIDRIDDLGLLNEFQQFYHGLNTDRLIAFMLAQTMAKTYQINGIIAREDTVKDKNDDIPKVNRSFFKNMDANLNPVNPQVVKSFFKHHG